MCKFVDHDLTIMNLTLYKASAGSGKTYTLTQAYIKQLLQPGTEARNILAITFTNAATSDMKRKIVEALAESAPEKLSQILHRYHEFSIKTIDSFVQNIIKPFAFELGLPRNYTPQIEEDLLAQDITALLLDRFGREGHEELSRNIQNFLAQREQNQKSLRIADRITEVVEMLFQEKSQAGVEKLSALTDADFRQATQSMESFCKNVEKAAADALQHAQTLLQTHNLTEKDFHEGKRGVYAWFTLQAPDIEKFAAPGTSVCKSVEKGILKKDSPLASELADCYAALRRPDYASYFIVKEVQGTVHALALLRQAREILHEIEEKTSDIPLSEFNRKIDKALREEGNDFIFERCGTRYRHIFIDEFQDTSRLQWKNLKPLVVNNLAQGYGCLVVGDAKQSLYRFRAADMEQFVDLCADTHSDPELRVSVRRLESNWRSEKGIIAFNNLFYSFILEHFDFSRPEIYKDHAQFYRTQTEALPEQDPQAVRICLVRNVDKEGARNFYERMLLNVLSKHPAGDVAVLCRRNDDCRAVADFLVGKGYKVSTPDSLKLSAHAGVKLLIASLQYIHTRHNYYREEVYELAMRLGLWKGGGGADALDAPHGLVAAAPPQADLYDTLQAVLRFWHMDCDADQYLLAFFDQVQKNRFGRIADLVRWYEDYAEKTALQAQGQDGSVTVMSIHKSKGLEFKVVVMPYIGDTGLNRQQLFWVDENLLPPEVKLPAALVRYAAKTLKNTSLKGEIAAEKQRIDLDNLNALYVATTRPCEKLYLFNHVRKESAAAQSGFDTNQAIAAFAEAYPQYVEYEEDGAELWDEEATETPAAPLQAP
ncbi:MAG: UvrD-helicase domain-containing protein, partial [Bacteroidales bacterium]|nr:UvrD-helicase domain-containing protein [Bacteroidales bacterium]